MNYFAYGSNMSLSRIQKRCPSAVAISIACIRKYSLRFHKLGADGSAKADMYWTGNVKDTVYGVIYSIAQKDVVSLDAAEGQGVHYKRKRCVVTMQTSQASKVQVYVAIEVSTKVIHPHDWYLRHIVIGAKENKLPTDYIRQLEAISTLKKVKKVDPYAYNKRSPIMRTFREIPVKKVRYTEIIDDDDDVDELNFGGSCYEVNSEPTYDYAERLDELAMYGLDEDDLL